MLQEGSGTAKVVMEKLEKLEKEKIVEQRRKKVAVEVEAEGGLVGVEEEIGLKELEGGVEEILFGVGKQLKYHETNLESTDTETLNQRNNIDIDSIEEHTDNIISTYKEDIFSSQSVTNSFSADRCTDISEVTRNLNDLQENFNALNNTLNGLIIRLLNVEIENKSLKLILSSMKIKEEEPVL